MNPETLAHSGDVQSLRAARVKRRLLEEHLRVKQLEGVSRRVALRESAEAWEWLDPYSDILGRLASPNEWTEGYLISTAADRRYGAFWPFWRSWQEHARLRAAARVLYTMSPTASGIINGVCSYVISDGMKAKAAARPGRSAPPALVEACNEAITEFDRENEFSRQQQEVFVQTQRDGDCGLRDFVQKDGMLVTRIVGGEYVVEPVNMDVETQSFGVQTDEEDTQTVEGFHVSYTGSPSDAEFVPADEMAFFKAGLNADANVKRGLTDLSFDSYDLIKSGSRLLENAAEGAAIQASIALIRQHDQADGRAVDEFVSGAADRQRTVAGRTLNETSYRPGRIEDIPKGQTYVAPPFMQNAQSAVTILQAVLRGAGQRWKAPEWLISGDASNGNFASALVAEAPFSRFCSSSQGYYGPRFRGVYEKAIKAKCDAGKMAANGVKWTWEEVKRFIEVTVEPPTLQVRDSLKEAQESAILIEAGISSRQIECQKTGNDWAQVERDNAEYAKAHPQPQMQPGQQGPGNGPKPPNATPDGGRGGGNEAGSPEDVRESLLEGQEDDASGLDAGAVVDIFYAVYGAKALGVLQKLAGPKGITEGWDGSLHPRGAGGKFIKKGSAEAVSSATSAVHGALKGHDTDPETLMGHLALLTVAQIREVASTHGHTAPKWLRGDLVKAVMDVVASHAKKDEKPQEKPEAPTPPADPAHQRHALQALADVGGLEATDTLRSAMPPELQGPAFDALMIALHDEGLINLSRDASAERLEGRAVVRDHNSAYSAASLTDAGKRALSAPEVPVAADPAPPTPASARTPAPAKPAARPRAADVESRVKQLAGNSASLTAADVDSLAADVQRLTKGEAARVASAVGMKVPPSASLKDAAKLVARYLWDRRGATLRNQSIGPDAAPTGGAAKGRTAGQAAAEPAILASKSKAAPSAAPKPAAPARPAWTPPVPQPGTPAHRALSVYEKGGSAQQAEVDGLLSELSKLDRPSVQHAAAALGMRGSERWSKAEALRQIAQRINDRRGAALRSQSIDGHDFGEGD